MVEKNRSQKPAMNFLRLAVFHSFPVFFGAVPQTAPFEGGIATQSWIFWISAVRSLWTGAAGFPHLIDRLSRNVARWTIVAEKVLSVHSLPISLLLETHSGTPQQIRVRPNQLRERSQIILRPSTRKACWSQLELPPK